MAHPPRFTPPLVLLACAVLIAGIVPARADIRDLIPFGRTRRIDALLPTVVSITMVKLLPDGPGQTRRVQMFGSGFIVDPTGIIITNRHVVSDVIEISATLQDGRTLPAHNIGVSESIDLALLKIDAGKPLPTVRWADSDRLHVGDQVMAVGNPLGVGESISAGIISGLNRNIRFSPFDDFIQTDAAINHGNSGGPLVDVRGEVVGVNTAIFSPTDTSGSIGIGFAIPGNDVQFVVDQLRRFGHIRFGSIGVGLQEMTPEIAEALRLAPPRGVVVARLEPGGPAAKAGLQEGDVVLKLGSQVPKDARGMARLVARASLGAMLPLTLWRDGRELSVPVMVEEWNDDRQETGSKPAPPQPEGSTDPAALGLTLAPLSDELRAQYKLPGDLNGVLVTEVAANSMAANRGVVTGSVIVKVEGSVVTTPAEVQHDLVAAQATKRRNALLLVRGPDTQQFVPLPIGLAPGAPPAR